MLYLPDTTIIPESSMALTSFVASDITHSSQTMIASISYSQSLLTSLDFMIITTIINIVEKPPNNPQFCLNRHHDHQ